MPGKWNNKGPGRWRVHVGRASNHLLPSPDILVHYVEIEVSAGKDRRAYLRSGTMSEDQAEALARDLRERLAYKLTPARKKELREYAERLASRVGFGRGAGKRGDDRTGVKADADMIERAFRAVILSELGKE